MNLKCKINGKEYELLVQGNTFSDEYNETLDSGNIILAHIKKIKNLKPFDDVYIYDGEFNGYDENGVVQGTYKFFKHFLVDSYTEEFVNIKDRVYKYKIALMSEIKALEKIQCPNISITQPLNATKKVSVWKYLIRYVEMYSPKYKKVRDKSLKKWEYVQKYTVDPELQKIFGNVYSHDFSLNAPTLRDILSKLMIVKDMIPYVENGVIKALDITQRKNKINLEDLPCTNIIGSMRSNEYCDALRRNYSEALSQDSTCSSVEYLGFRNSDSALMTLENMRLETRFPIYKINKMYMCYYKTSDVVRKDLEGNIIENFYYLCKQDITPLVKLNTERNALSQDWEKFSSHSPASVHELAKYKLCTLGYDIGSNIITGWGESYTYPKGWWSEGKNTYIENILFAIDRADRTGIKNYDYLLKDIDNLEGITIDTPKGIFNTIITPFATPLEVKNENVKSALDMKGLFFEIDYQGFFNGAVIHSKDNGLDNIVSNDNSSSSLALLELDGLSQKEKVNRLGNKTYQFTVRYDEYNDLSNLLNLGDYFSNEEEEDIIIYHREIAIYDNYVLATYFAAKDYVLKNYYTSVYARHRTWNLIPYGESVTRAENRKMFLNFSKKEKYYEYEKLFDFNYNFDFSLFFSAFMSTPIEYLFADDYEKTNKINAGYIEHNNNKYLSDANVLTSGNSLCFNIRMFDNISMGSYISKLNPFEGKYYDGTIWNELERPFFDTSKDYTGSNSALHMIVDDDKTGFTNNLTFSFFHYNQNISHKDSLQTFESEKSRFTVYNTYYNNLLILPKINNDYLFESNKISKEIEIYKDNKERIDMTFQIEPITTDKDILFSSWFMKLNDMLSNFYKIDENINYRYNSVEGLHNLKANFKIYAIYWTSFAKSITGAVTRQCPDGDIAISPDDVQKIREHYNEFFENSDIKINNMKSINYIDRTGDSIHGGGPVRYRLQGLRLELLSIVGIDTDIRDDGNYYGSTLKIKANQIATVHDYDLDIFHTIETQEILNFKSDERSREYKDKTLGDISEDFRGKEFFDLPTSFTTIINDERITFYPQNTAETVHTALIDLCNLAYDGVEAFEKERYDFDINVCWDKEPKKDYYKNMYIVLSSEKLKNTLVYDSYKIYDFPLTSIVLGGEKINEYIVPFDGETIKLNQNPNFDSIDFDSLSISIDANNNKYKEYQVEIDFIVNKEINFTSIVVRKYIDLNRYELIYRKASEDIIVYTYTSNSIWFWSDERYKIISGKGFENIPLLINNYKIIEKDYGPHILIKNNKIKSLDIRTIKEDFDKSWFYSHPNFDNDNIEGARTISFDINFKCIGNGREYTSLKFTHVISNDVETLSYGYIENGKQEYDIVYDSYGKGGRLEVNIYKNIIIKDKNNSEIVNWILENSEKQEINSIQYWFMNETQEKQEDNLLNFVFGVNLTEEDKQKDEIKVYASLISNRDPRVYDEHYNVIGKVHNYLDDNSKNYGEAQYYDEEDI